MPNAEIEFLRGNQSSDEPGAKVLGHAAVVIVLEEAGWWGRGVAPGEDDRGGTLMAAAGI